jgi:aconitate hydratase
MMKLNVFFPNKESDWTELVADAEATYDEYDEINLDDLVPLIALPTSPGNVVPVSEVAGKQLDRLL